MTAERPRRDFWRKVWIVLLLLAGLAAFLYEGVRDVSSTPLVKDGAPAPAFEAERYGGGTFSLADVKGKVVLLDFWATWCGPCVEEMPSLFKVAKEYAPRGVVLVAADRIESDEKAAVGIFLSNQKLVPDADRIVVFAAEDVLDRYQVHALPTLFLLDREGKIAGAHQGFMKEEELRRELDRVLAAGGSAAAAQP